MPSVIIALLSIVLVLAACGGSETGEEGTDPGEGNGIGVADGNDLEATDVVDDSNSGDDGSDGSDDSLDNPFPAGVTYRLSITGGSMAGTYEGSYFSACIRDYPTENNFNMHTLGEYTEPSLQLAVEDAAAAGSGEGTDAFNLMITFIAENGDSTQYLVGRNGSEELGEGGRAAVDQQATTASVHVDGIASTVIATSTKSEVLDEGVRVDLEAQCHNINSGS